eukprot:7292922-Prorocentrum_lima.AAC.1
MGPDTDTDSNISDLEGDEELQAFVNNYDKAEVSEYLCEAYFQAKRQWRQFTGRFQIGADPPHEKCLSFFVQPAA